MARTSRPSSYLVSADHPSIPYPNVDPSSIKTLTFALTILVVSRGSLWGLSVTLISLTRISNSLQFRWHELERHLVRGVVISHRVPPNFQSTIF